MRTELHRVQSDCYKLLLNTEGKKEETLELVVPDRCGDIGKILDVRGQIFLSSKTLREGEALISSRAELCVLFAAEGSGQTEYVSAQIPIEQSFAVAASDEDCELVVGLCLSSLDARALNPRKLFIRAECTCQLRCYNKGTFITFDGFDDNCAPPAHIKRCDLNHSLVTDLREKNFTISDEYSLPAKFSGAKMLLAETELSINDSKPVGNKLVLKAGASTHAVFLNPEDGSVFKWDFSTQFSQIIEITCAEDAECIVTALLKDTEFIFLPERETPCISMRLSMSAQVLCVQSVCSCHVSDAYSTNFDLSLSTEETTFKLMTAHQKLRIPLKGRMPISADCVLYLAPITVSCRAEGCRLICTAELSGIGREEDGQRIPLKLTLSAEEEVSLAQGQSLEIMCTCSDPVYIESNGEISLNATVEYCIHQQGSIEAVCAIEYDESCPCVSDRPSVVVLLAPGEQDAWTLAKKYRSTVELIEAVNNNGDNFSITRRPLIIPRA